MNKPTFWDVYDQNETGRYGSRKSVDPAHVFGQRGDWVQLLNIEADCIPTAVVVNMRAEYFVFNPVVSGIPPEIEGGIANPGDVLMGGPMVGRIRWGVGGAYNQVDFDIPAARNLATLKPIAQPLSRPVEDTGNGVCIPVSGAAFSVWARNDASIGFMANPAAASAPGFFDFPVDVMGFLSPHTGGLPSKLRRTIYIAGGNGGAPPALPNVPLTFGTTVAITIPAFASAVWFPRLPDDSTPLHVVTLDNSDQILRDFNVGVNFDGPFPLIRDEVTMNITNVGGVDITQMQAVFEIDISR